MTNRFQPAVKLCQRIAPLAPYKWAQYNYLRRANAGTAPISSLEASLANAAKTAVEYSADRDGDGVIDATESTAVIVLTGSGHAADLITKYRPPCPVFVATHSAAVVGCCSCWVRGLYPV